MSERENSAQTIKLKFRYEEDEYVSATRLFYFSRIQTYYAFFIPFLLVLGGFIGQLVTDDNYLWFIPIFIGFIQLYNLWLGYFGAWRQQFRDNPILGEEYFVQLSEEGVFYRSRNMESKYKWDFYTRVWEKSGFFYLFYSQELYSMIPKRVFENEAQEAAFRKLLEQKIVARPAARLPETERVKEVNEYVPPQSPPDWR